MPIALKPKRQNRYHHMNGTFKAWKKSAAFAVNPRGILTHRVKHVDTIMHNGKKSHHHVHYWCQNGCNFEVGYENEVLTDKPPKGRLLCHFCENNAQAKRQPNADKLAGRHVHRGVLKAHQVCCGNEF